MSTHATIAYHNSETDRVLTIYCHSDGYPSHVGKLLKEHWNSPDLAAKLVAGGDISYLGKTIDQTCVYARDRGDKWIHVKYDEFDNYDEFLEEFQSHAHNYVFTDGEWLVITREFPNVRQVPLSVLV